MQPGMMEERPPFVRFERRAVEKRRLAPPAGDGSIYYDDVDFAIITPQGTKDVVEKITADWFNYLKTMVGQRRYNPAWLKGFEEMYDYWKKGLDLPVNGFAIKNWPAATPAEVKRLAEIRIFTVEDLAGATEEAIGRLGMGGRSLKQRAVDFITAQKGTAPLVTQLDAMRTTLETLGQQVTELRAENGQLKDQLQRFQMTEMGINQAAPQESLANRLAAAQQDNEIEFENLTKL